MLLAGCIDDLPPATPADGVDAGVIVRGDRGPVAVDAGADFELEVDFEAGPTRDVGPRVDDAALPRPDRGEVTDPTLDTDHDGTPDVDDCEPDNAAVHPDAIEACNAVDDDCDGMVDEQAASVGTCTVGEGRCRSEGGWVCEEGRHFCDAPAITPEPEIPRNQVDDDCDGLVDELECPVGTVGDAEGRTCMWVGSSERLWGLGDLACESQRVASVSGHMATLEVPSEVELARAVVAGHGPLWVGAARVNAGETWRWNSGAPLPVGGADNLWAAGEPNNAGIGEWCAQVRDDGLLNDENCLNRTGVLCEVKQRDVP